jgi:hypothetical protein
MGLVQWKSQLKSEETTTARKEKDVGEVFRRQPVRSHIVMEMNSEQMFRQVAFRKHQHATERGSGRER